MDTKQLHRDTKQPINLQYRHKQNHKPKRYKNNHKQTQKDLRDIRQQQRVIKQAQRQAKCM